MPLYEYECDACGHRFEVIQKYSDALIEKCPVCGGVVHKLFSSPAIQFKGTGWYITDYARKDSSPSGEAGKSAKEGSADSKSESKTEAKTESKTDSKESKSETKSESKADSKPPSKSTDS